MNTLNDAIRHLRNGKPHAAVGILRGVFNRSRDVQKRGLLLAIVRSLEDSQQRQFSVEAIEIALRRYAR